VKPAEKNKHEYNHGVVECGGGYNKMLMQFVSEIKTAA
jgi:hypothetical protein